MLISQEALLKIALKLEHPWYIMLTDFSAEGATRYGAASFGSKSTAY